MAQRERGSELHKFDVAFFAASTDEFETTKKFADQLKLDYLILSDPDKKVAEAYGVVHPGRAVPERWTFYIGKDGTVKYVDQKVNPKEHGKDIAKKLEELGVPKK